MADPPREVKPSPTLGACFLAVVVNGAAGGMLVVVNPTPGGAGAVAAGDFVADLFFSPLSCAQRTISLPSSSKTDWRLPRGLEAVRRGGEQGRTISLPSSSKIDWRLPRDLEVRPGGGEQGRVISLPSSAAPDLRRRCVFACVNGEMSRGVPFVSSVR